MEAIAATVRTLAVADRLPGPSDYEVLLPPVHRAWCRRIASHNLWLFYRLHGDDICLLALSRSPPVPATSR